MIRVVKCGGQVLDDPALLETFCRDFATLEGPKVLVHGGGALVWRWGVDAVVQTLPLTIWVTKACPTPSSTLRPLSFNPKSTK